MKDSSQVRVTGPLGPYAEGFRAELARQGYASSSAVNQLKLVGHLSRWMTMEGLSVPELVPAEIERYVAARRAARYRHNLSEQGLRPLLEYLRGLGGLGEDAGHGAALAAAVPPRGGPQRDPAGRRGARGRPVAGAFAPARPQPGGGGAAAWQLRSAHRHRPARLCHLGRARAPGAARR